MIKSSPTLALTIADEAAPLLATAMTGLGPASSQQLSGTETTETQAAEASWQATVRDGADVVLTHEGPLLQVLTLAVVIGRFWPALRVCVRRQQHPSAAPEPRGLRRR